MPKAVRSHARQAMQRWLAVMGLLLLSHVLMAVGAALYYANGFTSGSKTLAGAILDAAGSPGTALALLAFAIYVDKVLHAAQL